MVRPSQERATLALTDAQSVSIGSGTAIGDDGFDYDGGGTNPDAGPATPPVTQTVRVISDSSTWDKVLDFAESSIWDITLGANLTGIVFANPPPAGVDAKMEVTYRQPSSGGPYTLDQPAEADWQDTDGTGGGAEPTMPTAAESVLVVTFDVRDGGTSYGGTYDSVGGVAPGSAPFIVVTDEGMVGDDSTDNTAAFQAIIDGLSGGELIYFPPGIYQITDEIDIDVDQVQLWGAGGEYSPSVIKQVTADTGALNFPNSLAANQMGASLVRGLWLQGPGSATAGDGIYALAGVNVENCTITDFYVGLHWDHETYYHRATGCFFSGNAHAATEQDGVNNTTVRDCRVHNSGGPSPSGTGPGAFGHIIYGSIGCRIIGGTVEQCTTDHIYLDANFSVTNNYTYDTYISSVYFETSSGSATSYVRIGASGTDVVYDTVIEACYMQGNTAASFWAIDGDYAETVTIIGGSIGNTGMTNGAIRGSANSSGWLLLNPLIIDGTVSLPTDSYHLDPAAPPMTNGDAAGGDLAGTYPNPTVDAVQGVTVTDAGTTGDVLTKTGASTATWSTPSSGGSGVGPILISDTPSTPLIFADLIQNEAQDDLVYADV